MSVGHRRETWLILCLGASSTETFHLPHSPQSRRLSSSFHAMSICDTAAQEVFGYPGASSGQALAFRYPVRHPRCQRLARSRFPPSGSAPGFRCFIVPSAGISCSTLDQCLALEVLAHSRTIRIYPENFGKLPRCCWAST